MSESPIRMLDLSLIKESPTNPRKTYNQAKDDELGESVSKLGVLQPVLVRPAVGADFELVIGHRRFRAAKKAGLLEIPAMVREMTDLEVLEAQVVENTQREDVHPLEEAEAFERLHQAYGQSVDEIAAKVGKSRAYVYGRLKLCALSPKARAAAFAGKIGAETALLIARIPSLKLQDEATKAIVSGPRWGYGRGEPMSYRAAKSLVTEEFMVRLSDATFSLTDETLVPNVGSCSKCPLRTGNQRELFEDVKRADVCTNPPCFEKKVEADWKKRAADARANGQTVLEGKKAEAARFSSEYVYPGNYCYEDGKSRTYKQLLGKDAPPAVLIRTQDGEVREVFRAADVKKVLREKGVTTQRDRSAQTGRNPAEEMRRKVQLEIERHVLEQLAARAPKIMGSALRAWRWLARAVVDSSWHDLIKRVAARREVERTKDDSGIEGFDDALVRWIDKADVAACQGLVFEVLASRSLSSLHKDEEDDMLEGYRERDSARRAAELAKIDLKAVARSVTKDVEAKRAERKKAAKSKAKASPKQQRAARNSGAGTCRECGCTEADCSECIAVLGEPCVWDDKRKTLCSRCADGGAD